MKYKILDGTFEQVEPSISDSFVENSLDTMKTFRGFKLLGFIFFFIACITYLLYGGSVYMVNHMEEAVGGLDLNNEFISFMSSIWYAHLTAFPITMLVIFTMYYRNRNRVKGHVIYYLLMTIYTLLISLLLFKVMQLLVSYFILRIIYTTLFILTLSYSIWLGYQNAIHMIYGKKKRRSKVVEWFSRNFKSILPILLVIGGAYFILKVIFEPAADLETRVIGSMADFMPLFMVGTNFAFIYYIGVIVRSYYVHKYSERFRVKFQYDKEDWYGQKYKG